MKKILYQLNAFREGVETKSWFESVSQKKCMDYCSKYGADYKCIEVEKPHKFPAHYHKCDVFEDFLKSDYDRGIFFDMDIYIEQDCPDLWNTKGTCMVFDYLFAMNLYEEFCRHMKHRLKNRYKGPTKHNWLPKEHCWRYFNTGVIVFDRDFAKFITESVKPIEHRDNGDIAYPDHWGEQSYFNLLMDRADYPIHELSRDYNEMTGLTRNLGKYISHYAAPWGRHRLAQRQIHGDQASFQRKYAKGKILNIGCSTDYASLRDDFGAYNLDYNAQDPKTLSDNKYDELCDARELPEKFMDGSWDCAVLGDILEHMSDEDRVKSINCAKRTLKKNGWLIITVPHDPRPVSEQVLEYQKGDDYLLYAPGVYAFHNYLLKAEDIEKNIATCGLEILSKEKICYQFGIEGTCWLAVTPEMRQACRDRQELIFDIREEEVK